MERGRGIRNRVKGRDRGREGRGREREKWTKDENHKEYLIILIAFLKILCCTCILTQN